MLALSSAALRFAGFLKLKRGWRTGYTRKLFHFLTFGSAAVLQFAAGPVAVCLFGGMTSLVILFAVLSGDGSPMYEPLAREKDAPHRTWYIVVPCVATLIGGLTIAAFFPRTAVIGYLVRGIGDAVGEPVGTRFGRHPYRVLLPGRVPCQRSLEGSFGVFVASSLAALVGALSIPGIDFGAGLIARAFFLGVVAASLEAVSPHGWDNAVMMIVPAAIGV
jgi:phytol kinase